MNLKRISKAVAATVGGIGAYVATVVMVFDDDVLDNGEISALIVGFVTLVTTIYSVWRVPNASQNV